MARKRMISPEIWESQNFSLLSDIAKIVFISLFSHADDEGRGRADPTFIKNITFPYDENRRAADIKTALSEIARSMSVQFYSVNGIDYYFMTHWGRWQKVEKPSKSKLPPPPSVGEGGAILSNEEFGECSGNSRGIVGEGSPTNRIEKNRIEAPLYPPSGEKAEGGGKKAFFNTYPALAAFKGKYDDSVVDYSILMDRFSKSERLRKTYSMKWVCENYAAIKDGLFADKAEELNRVAWEQWNYDRKHAAEEKADKALNRATADKVYGSIRKELNELSIQLAFAEIKDKPKAEEITKRIKELEEQGDKRLKELGIDKAQFTPHYSCTCCNDTGYTEQGFICKNCLKEFEVHNAK